MPRHTGPLAPNQKRFLRSLGHHLSPVVQIGHQGVTPGTIAALTQALADHELVKVKLAQAVEDRAEATEALAEGTESECAQMLGRTALFYRQHPKRPKIALPAPRVAAEGNAPEESEEDEAPGEEDADSMDESEA
jgi:RNA-binding protein